MRTLLLACCLLVQLSAVELPFRQHPDLTQGQLENGLRYAIMAHQQPAGKVSLRLRIASGSLNETEEQRGLAHYLEHLAFNGSTHFPAGTFVTRLQEAGIAFGAHSNAHTSFDETVYKIDLPNTQAETLDLGFLALADQAGGLLLEPEEIERERGVILAEMRDRNSPGFRQWLASSAQLYAGTRIPERAPIGTEASIQAATPALIRDYYETWYRPDRMLLVVVGDIDTQDIEMRVRQYFATLHGHSGPDRELGTLQEGRTVALLPEPEANGLSLRLQQVRKDDKLPDSLEKRNTQWLRDSAEQILSRRLQRRIEEAGDQSPLLSASPFSYPWLGLYNVGLEARIRTGQSQEALRWLMPAWRAMASYGPTASEMEQELQRQQAEAENAVRQAGSQSNAELANEILSSLGDQKVYLSPQDYLDLLSAWSQAVSPSAVQTAFAAGLPDQGGRQVLLLSGQLEHEAINEQQLLEAYQAAIAEPISPPQAITLQAWAYPDPPAYTGPLPGPADDLGIRSGIIDDISVSGRSSKAQPGEVLVSLRFDARTAPRPQTAATWLQAALMQGGLGKHSASELALLFAATSIRPQGIEVADDALSIFFACQAKDLPRLFALARAAIDDAGWRPDAEARFRTQWLSQLRAEETLVQPTLLKRLTADWYATQPWRQVASREAVEHEGFAETRAWIESMLRSAPLSVAIAGDCDLDQAFRATAALSGNGRPLATAFPSSEALRASLPPMPATAQGQHAITINGAERRSLVVQQWPSDDLFDVHKARRLLVLAQILGEHLREELRERLGQAYSPQVSSTQESAYRGDGVLRLAVSVSPDQVQVALGLMDQVVERVLSTEPSEELLHRVLRPLINDVVALRTQNRYWLRSVLHPLASQPFRREWSRSMAADFQQISAQEIHALAREVLRPETRYQLTVTSLGKE